MNPSVGTSLPSGPYQILSFHLIDLQQLTLKLNGFFFFTVILLFFFGLCTWHPELQQTFWAELFVLPDRPHTSEEQIKDQPALFGFNLPPAKLKCQTHLSGSG